MATSGILFSANILTGIGCYADYTRLWCASLAPILGVWANVLEWLEWLITDGGVCRIPVHLNSLKHVLLWSTCGSSERDSCYKWCSHSIWQLNSLNGRSTEFHLSALHASTCLTVHGKSTCQQNEHTSHCITPDPWQKKNPVHVSCHLVQSNCFFVLTTPPNLWHLYTS